MRELDLELVSIETDTHPLDGIFYEPRGGATAGCVMILHGNCMNFYTGVSRFMPEALGRLGYAVLTFNRRGHDILATLNSREAVGGAFQRIDEAIKDNEYAAAWLADRGFPAPVVIGHSNGGMLAVRHCASHPETPALILMSAHGGGKNMVPFASKAGLLAQDRVEEFQAKARAMVAEGRGRELFLLPGWWYVAAADSFVDYSDRLPDTLELAPQIGCPVLYIRGSEEPPALYPAEAFAERAAGPCRVEIVPDCDHFYTGLDAPVAALVTDWLADLASGAGRDRPRA